MTRSLPELRQAIDAVDRELLAVLNRRAALANEVGDIKRAEGSPVFRPEREAQVINGLKASNPGPLKDNNVANIWREIMSACRALEAPQRVAFLGPAGTFSEQAAVQFFGSSIERVPCVSIDEVFRATAAGTAEYGVVPVENSTEGVVARSLDLFLNTPLHIVGETSLLVRHNLLRTVNSLEGVEVVLAHPQALAQCQGRRQQRRRRAPGRHRSGLGRHRQRPRRHRVRPAHRRPRHPGRRLQPHPFRRGVPAPDPAGARSLRQGLREPDRLRPQPPRRGA
jgi:chorismate mutase/prephenate dehydratase